MYQHTKLYELSISTKVLLTGFIVATCTAGLLAVVAFHYACKDADGDPTISFTDIKTVVLGSRLAVLERAAQRPRDFGLGRAGTADLENLKSWCAAGAPRKDFLEILALLEGSPYGAPLPKEGDGAPAREEYVQRQYERIAALARRRAPLSTAQLATDTTIYLGVVAVAFLGLGLMFVGTSLFEKTKVFFVAATFVFAMAWPAFLWLGRDDAGWLYMMLLAGFLLGVCFGVLALVALYDLWFRRPAG